MPVNVQSESSWHRIGLHVNNGKYKNHWNDSDNLCFDFDCTNWWENTSHKECNIREQNRNNEMILLLYLQARKWHILAWAFIFRLRFRLRRCLDSTCCVKLPSALSPLFVISAWFSPLRYVQSSSLYCHSLSSLTVFHKIITQVGIQCVRLFRHRSEDAMLHVPISFLLSHLQLRLTVVCFFYPFTWSSPHTAVFDKWSTKLCKTYLY